MAGGHDERLILLNEEYINPGRLAWLPLAFLAEQDDQQAEFSLLAECDIAYRDVLTTGLWTYQLYSYQTLVRQHYGEEVVKQVRALQCEIFDREQPGAGAAIDSALQLVEMALHASVVGGNAGSVNFVLPAELAVALALLLGLPESPDYYQGSRGDDQPVSSVPGIDERLANLLAKGQTAMLEAFTPLFSVALSS